MPHPIDGRSATSSSTKPGTTSTEYPSNTRSCAARTPAATETYRRRYRFSPDHAGDAQVLRHREGDVWAVVLDRGLAGEEGMVRGPQQVAKFGEVDLVEVAGGVGCGDQRGADLPPAPVDGAGQEQVAGCETPGVEADPPEKVMPIVENQRPDPVAGVHVDLLGMESPRDDLLADLERVRTA